MTKIFNLTTEYDAGIEYAAHTLKEGGLAVFPTETVYGLGAHALDEKAVEAIFEAKGRPSDNPLIVHIHSIEQAYDLAHVSPQSHALMQAFWPAPLTIILPKKDVPAKTTGGLDTVALRMPKNTAALDLLKKAGIPVAAPSANTSGRPSPTRAQHVIEDMNGKVEVILDGGDCDFGVESTVVKLTHDICTILRPGAITKSMLEKYMKVQLAHGVLEHTQIGSPESPGMKYRHYAPRAKVYVVDTKNEVAKKIISLYDIDVLNGLKSLILCSDQNALRYERRRVYALGSDINAIAKSLFAALRYADETACDTVYFEAVEQSEMGLAVMNRILRAAEFSIIKDI